jgi:hypothetical protein
MVAPCEWIARDEAEWRERRVVVSVFCIGIIFGNN